MLPAARVGDLHTCPMVTPGVPPIPHVGGPILPPGAPLTMVGGPFAARLSDMATCVGPPDVIAMGSASVLVQGLPAARQTDTTAHGGLISVGLPTVLIGGPAFALPPNIKVDGPPLFQQQTLRDLYFLSTTPTGQAILARLAAAGKPVTIVPNPGINGHCVPNDRTAAGDGTGSGSTVQYNPNYRSNAFDAAGNMIAQPPQVILGHELCHAVSNAEGTRMLIPDPAPPASEPGLSEREARAIGTGSHNGRNPSENSLRNDLGLPRRDNHIGTGGPRAGEPTPLNLRPGDPPL